MRALLLVSVLAAAFAGEMVLTPFGYRLSQCILEVDSGSHIYTVGSAVRVTQESNGQITSSYDVVVPEECHHDGFVENLRQKRQARTQVAAPGVPDGWLDYAGSYPLGKDGNISAFSSLYTVPGDPATNAGQVLFYFIGIQDNNYAAVNILQPVLTWGNGVTGWNLASWDCCPNNITTKSRTITGFGAGDVINGTMYRQDASTWVIDSTIVKSGANTTLVSHVGTYLYDWPNVCLEVYSTATCPEFAKGPMQFTSLNMKDGNGAAVKPTWTLTGATGCSGSIKQDGNGNFNITHSQTG